MLKGLANRSMLRRPAATLLARHAPAMVARPLSTSVPTVTIDNGSVGAERQLLKLALWIFLCISVAVSLLPPCSRPPA